MCFISQGKTKVGDLDENTTWTIYNPTKPKFLGFNCKFVTNNKNSIFMTIAYKT